MGKFKAFLSLSSAAKKMQQRNFLVLAIVICFVAAGVYEILGGENAPAANPQDKTQSIAMATPLSHVDVEQEWIEQAQNQVLAQQKTSALLNQQVTALQQNKVNEQQILQQQAQQIEDLQQKITALQQQKTEGLSQNLPPAAPAHFINNDNLPLLDRPDATLLVPTKNPATFVPAGTFARAIALGGADASAGVSSQADPTPMLFRILDEGTLPNHRHSSLKNCVATAASIGDISSERGMIRLERISCTRPDGQIIEIPVEATVFGPDGKNGVRGIPLWREGSLLARAFAAGTLSGLSSGIAQSYTTSNLTPLGTTQTVDNNKILQYGLAAGIGNAAEKLADYNIQRAEQYHPVIQLSAGTLVDIVVLKGFYLDGKAHSDKEPLMQPVDSSSNLQSFLSNAPSANTENTENVGNNENSSAQPLPLTPAQIAALKQKNAAQGYF